MNKLTNWACWGGIVLSLSLLAARIASAGGLRICDCSGAVLVGATLMAFMPPIAGIGYFIIQLLGSWKRGRWQGFSRLSTFCALPVAVAALNSMAVSGLICPLCLGVWVCFGVVAVATLRHGLRLSSPSSAMRSLVATAVLLLVGIGIAQNPPPPPRNTNCTNENCCKVGCFRSSDGWWRAYRVNGYDKYKRADGPGVVSKACPWIAYDNRLCRGEHAFDGSDPAKCCDWRIAPNER
ncbi:MAG: hypothetical protein AMXMBFR61_24120 [Fimbriimonadales bacterium]